MITAEGAKDAEEEMLNAKLSAERRMESLVPRFQNSALGICLLCVLCVSAVNHFLMWERNGPKGSHRLRSVE